MDTHQSFENENGGWRRVKKKVCAAGAWSRPNFRGQINSASTIYKNVILPLRITKMPLLDLKCWPSHSNDMEMTWK